MNLIRMSIVLFCCFICSVPAYALTLISPAQAGELNLTGDHGVLDQLYGMENLLRVDDSRDKLWMRTGGAVNVTAKARFAGYSFLFGYEHGTGFQSLFGVHGSNLSVWDSHGSFSTDGPFSWNIDPSGAPIWSSNYLDNSDLLDHMVTYLITSGTYTGNYILAWEDLSGLGDRDYNDLVLEVGGAKPYFDTPEPATFTLLGACLLVVWGTVIRRKKFTKSRE